jgi:hypothetical protein
MLHRKKWAVIVRITPITQLKICLQNTDLRNVTAGGVYLPRNLKIFKKEQRLNDDIRVYSLD